MHPISAAAAVNKTFAGTECPADGSAKAKTQTTSSILEECSMASIENSHGEGESKGRRARLTGCFCPQKDFGLF